jgi:NTE family protein
MIVHDGVRLTLHTGGDSRVLSWTEVASLPWDRFSVAYGGGGITGLCFETGVLLALALDHGVDFADAERVVATSSGAIAASLVALGFQATDLAALIARSDDHVSPHLHGYGASLQNDLPMPPSFTRLFRRQSPASMLASVRCLAERDIRALVLRTLRDGTFDLRSQLAFLRHVEWTELSVPTAVCVADGRSGVGIVLTERDGISLFDAVLASCAIPAIVSPVRVGDITYVDGGVSSPTSADLLAGADDPPFTVVLSPMTASGSRTWGGRLSTRYARARLQPEVATLAATKTVLVIEPVGRLGQHVIDRPPVEDSAIGIVRSSFLTVGLCA